MPRRHFSGLWRNGDFLKLWAGETVSWLGSQITVLALPLVAALTLRATPLQMGTLGLVQFSPWLLVGLFAGVWVDRLPRRPIMIIADIGRAALLMLVPIASVAGFLAMGHLYLVGFLVGTLNVFFEVAYGAYLPTLISREMLVEGNGKLQASASIAEIGGPSLAGLLTQIIGAPIAIIGDALSFLVSALCLRRIRSPEPTPAAGSQATSVVNDIRDGLRFVLRHPILRAFIGCSVTGNFFVDVHLAVYILYMTRELSASPGMIGVIGSIASIGSLLGAIVAERAARWLGLGRVTTLTQLCHGLSALAIGLAGAWPSAAIPLIVTAQFIWALTGAIYAVNAVSLRQIMTPTHLLGRASASIRTVTWGIAPIGFVLGGLLGERVGLQPTLVIAGMGLLLSNAWLLFSPLTGVRDVSTVRPAEALAE